MKTNLTDLALKKGIRVLQELEFRINKRSDNYFDGFIMDNVTNKEIEEIFAHKNPTKKLLEILAECGAFRWKNYINDSYKDIIRFINTVDITLHNSMSIIISLKPDIPVCSRVIMPKLVEHILVKFIKADKYLLEQTKNKLFKQS